MNKLRVILLTSCLIMAFGGPAYCHGLEEIESEFSYGFRWEVNGVMRHALGSSYLQGPGWDLNTRGWFSMPRENQERLSEMRMNYQKATLELRKQLVAKQLEITTLWAQTNVDRPKIEALSVAVAKLQEELGRKRDQHLLRCRQELGGSDWACPGFWQ